MNSFCEECGHKLNPGDIFCEECGNPVENQDTDNKRSKPQNGVLNWEFFLSKRSPNSPEVNETCFGILLTNFKQFETKFGPSGVALLKQHLNQYLDNLKAYGIYYLVLDASDNYLKTPNAKNWKQHVSLLCKAIKRVKSQLKESVYFICVLGGDEIIPMPVFDTPVPLGEDKDIDSDLPYSTLSVYSPDEKAEARQPQVAMGRIPTGIDTSVDTLSRYFKNAIEALGNFQTPKTFGLSAYCWKGASQEVNSRVCNNNLYLSPALTLDNINQHYSPDTNIHYFNLHGGSNTRYWYGDDGQSQPQAFSPRELSQSRVNNVVGVEACYGARFINLKTDESVLLTALANRTVSFVGSSRIAIGPSAPPINYADIVIHDFLGHLQNGVPSGEAFVRARQHVLEHNMSTSPQSGLLSLMEFNLFGDPAFTIFSDTEKNMSAKSAPEQKIFVDADALCDFPEQDLELPKEIRTTQNSLYGMVSQAVDAAQQRITELINKKVWEKYPDFKNISPSCLKFNFGGKSYNQLAYHKKQDVFDKVLLVDYDSQGTITDENESK